MKFIKSIILSVLMFGSSIAPNIAAADEPYPLDYFALRNVISNVQVSPNGKRIALLKIPSKDGNAILEVYDANDLSKKPYVVAADPMEITRFSWASDSGILLSLRQKVRKKIKGFNRGVYDGKIAILDVDKKSFKTFDEINPGISNLLPNKANKVILSFNPGGSGTKGLSSAFRPRHYYEFDLKSGRKKLLIQGKLALGQIEFDGNGTPWLARGFDLQRGEFVRYIRKPGQKGWTEFHRLSEDSFESFRVSGYDENDRNILFVTAHNGRDKLALWEYNVDQKKFGELIYARNDVNVGGVRYHSNAWTNPDTVVGVSYSTDKRKYEYFDDVEAATYKQIESLIPAAHSFGITSRSRDGKTLTVSNSGPRDPGTYYLFKNGKITTIGSRQPLLESDQLADVKYISWKARDGKKIHGFLTVPNTKGPYPLIVMPHGGPYVSEIVGYDEWGQMLANNGYAVLQPQYRGSRNFGLDFYKAAFIDGSEAGHKMQDDKDDGAMYLIKEGLVAEDRVAMFGWSYGGYAALVAASREDQIHQCVIAGAAVSDPIMQVNYYRNRGARGASKVEQVTTWVDGVSPLKEVEKVNVPLFLIHGSVDQRVPPEHAKKYLKLLEKYNKNYKYLELDGADHFSNTLFYNHQKDLYEGIIDFLKNDCGPGGL